MRCGERRKNREEPTYEQPLWIRAYQGLPAKDGDRIIEWFAASSTSAGKLLEHCKTRLHLNNARCHGNLGEGRFRPCNCTLNLTNSDNNPILSQTMCQKTESRTYYSWHKPYCDCSNDPQSSRTTLPPFFLPQFRHHQMSTKSQDRVKAYRSLPHLKTSFQFKEGAFDVFQQSKTPNPAELQHKSRLRGDGPEKLRTLR